MTSEPPDGIAVDPVVVIEATCAPDESAACEMAASDVDRRTSVRAAFRIPRFGRAWRNAEVGVA